MELLKFSSEKMQADMEQVNWIWNWPCQYNYSPPLSSPLWLCTSFNIRWLQLKLQELSWN